MRIPQSAPALRAAPGAAPATTLAVMAVLGAVAVALSHDARAVLSLLVPHLGGADSLQWPTAVLRVAVLALLVSTLLMLADAPLRRPRRKDRAGGAATGADAERLDRSVLVGRVAATALVALTAGETVGPGISTAPPGRDTAVWTHVLALVGTTWALASLVRPARTVLTSSGWTVLVLAVTQLPLVLLGGWLGQPETAGSPVAVVSRAAWLLAVVLIVGPALSGLLGDAADRSAAAGATARRRFQVVPVTGVLAAGYAALLAVSAAELTVTSLLVLLACGAAAAVVVRQRDVQRARVSALVALGILAGLVWLLSPPAPSAPSSAVAGHAGMAMAENLPPIDAQAWFTAWTFDPLFAPLAVLATGAYLAAVGRLRRRGHRWPVARTFVWCLGWALFVWATNGAPAVYGMALFSMHMVQHMTISMAVPAFLVLAAPISLAFRALDPRADGSRGCREWLLVLVHSRLFQVVASPLVAPPLFVVSLMVFYFSPLFELAMASYTGHVLMTVHFLLSGYLFAWVLVGVDPGPARPPYPLRLMILIITMGFHAFFGIIIMSSDVVLAEEWFAANGPSWVDLAQDQYVGGALAWGLGDYPVAILSVALAFAWLRDDDRERRRYDRQADRDDDATLAAYNAYLQSLDRPVKRPLGTPPPRSAGEP